MGESFRFAAKDEEIIFSKVHAVIRTLGFGSQKKITRAPGLRPPVARRTNPTIVAVPRPNNRGLPGAIADRRAKTRTA